MPHRFGRPVPPDRSIASFLDEAGRMRAFLPPFRFSSFFSPEDTLLCAIASEAALSRARQPGSALRIAELTTGSGLVGLHLLRLEYGSTLTGFDVDEYAIEIARANAAMLGLSQRARFECVDLWSPDTSVRLVEHRPHLLICNPPYVPEPPDNRMAIEAGAGPDGTAHLMHAITLAGQVHPRAMALSWCSLSDPGCVVSEAERAGYRLNSLFIVAIGDGDYSGTVHSYLRTIDNAYLSEHPDALKAVAPDGAARFAYLLMAGDFSRSTVTRSAAKSVERLCADFVSRGIAALADPVTPVPTRAWLLDRWDEMRLRAYLHGGVPLRAT
jgi:SAM-dependent methyltransferase